ncbi:serine hydrolase domain-containing protein [Novipirellula artificiosorum]|uniref:Esterase EstB n=1 Tax=Novipirellula artificiosorum TaxID=2528016 RepID=A0A5C6D6U6_9BACT|nr:serine hydrolase domain-containing protein [Novipirellula artificiosorum]TWU30966.1 Esterase EstB [Novipirellula artificiosorum]
MLRCSRLTAMLLVFSCFTLSVGYADDVTAKRSAPAVEAIDQAMQAFVDSGDLSGAVTLVGHDRKIVHYGAVGHADLDSGKPMTRQTLFSIASMTKPITSTAVMMLVEEGKLDLDDEVSKFIPAFASVKLSNGESPQRQITLRDCLTHTSGLHGTQSFSDSLREAVDELSQRPLAFEPGSKWKYSPGLNVAARIVEIVSEQPFEAFLQKRIFDPLGMKNTTFYPESKQQRRIATQYRLSDERKLQAVEDNRITNLSSDPNWPRTQGPNPSGGLYSTARDLFAFYQMILNQGQFRGTRLLTKESIEQMTSPQTADLETGFTPGNCWGLGWCIIRDPQGVSEMLSPGTFGHGGAFGTQGWVDPKTKTISILMIQRTDLPNSDNSEMRAALHRSAAESIGIEPSR